MILVSYSQAYDDTSYNPLPRDIVVRANRIGRNGWDPQFPGGAQLAKAVGGGLPPVMWDGVDNYTRKGATAPEAVRLNISDGPVVNLNLPAPGQVMRANPKVTPTIDGGVIVEPKAVVLPKAQVARGS